MAPTIMRAKTTENRVTRDMCSSLSRLLVNMEITGCVDVEDTITGRLVKTV